jgi:phosphatidylglycerol lysyltransferase
VNATNSAADAPATDGARLCPDLAVRLPYVTQYGAGCMAYSTLAEGVEAFVVPGIGYVAYARQRLFGERVFALADPIAPPERWGEVIDRFVAEHPKAMFVQSGDRTAALLRERGFYVNEMGTETEIDVQTFKLGWRKRKSVTYMCSLAKRSEPTLREIPAADVSRERVRAISDEWISTRVSASRELKFLTRPAVFGDEPGVRKFYSCVRDEVIGFAYFSPMYEDGKVIGYLFDVHRHIADEPAARKDETGEPEAPESSAGDAVPTGGTRIPELLAKGIRGAPRGLTDWTLVEAMNVFRAEGARTLSLGFSPFHDVDDRGPGHSPFTRWLLRTSYTKLEWLYHNTGNAMFKQRWKGTTKKVYFAARGRYPVLDLLAIYRLCGAF